MESKLKELLDAINFDKEEYSSFLNVSLKKVKVSKEKMHIILNSEKVLKLNTYLRLNECLNNFFHVNCILEVQVKNSNYENIRECFDYATNFSDISFLKERLKNNYNSYYIELNNESEKRQCKVDLDKINEILMRMGYPKLEIMINEFQRNKVEEAINKDLKVKITPPTVNEVISPKPNHFEGRPKKIETVDDERVILGKVIE